MASLGFKLDLCFDFHGVAEVFSAFCLVISTQDQFLPATADQRRTPTKKNGNDIETHTGM